MHAPRAVAISLATVALVGSSCGDSQREKYREDFNEASGTFVKELNEGLAIMRQRRSRKQYAEGAEGLQVATQRFKDDVEELDTPGDAEDEEKKLIVAVDEFGTAVGTLNSAVQSGRTKQIAAEGARLAKEAGDVDQEIARMKEAVE